MKQWSRIEIRPGEKGPLVIDAVKVRVQTRRGRRNGPEETLVVFRERQGRKVVKHDYALSNAPFKTPLREFARVLLPLEKTQTLAAVEETTKNLTYTVKLSWYGFYSSKAASACGVKKVAWPKPLPKGRIWPIASRRPFRKIRRCSTLPVRADS